MEPPLATAPEAPFVEVPVSRMRRTIARRLTSAKQEIPHFYLELDCDFEALLELRAGLNRHIGERKTGVTDFAIKAAACALCDVPAANAGFVKDAVRLIAEIADSAATVSGITSAVRS